LIEPEDEIVDSGDMLAKDEGSDSDDEPEPPVTKSVTFADATDTKVESASADEAPASGTTSGAQSVPLSASRPQTILRSGRVGYQTNFFKSETNYLVQLVMSRSGTSAAEANYLAHMLEIDNKELAASQILMEDTFSPKYLMSLYEEMVAESGEPLELMGVGAGAGGGYGHTDELRVMNYREARQVRSDICGRKQSFKSNLSL
jgi:hypothetical protein